MDDHIEVRRRERTSAEAAAGDARDDGDRRRGRDHLHDLTEHETRTLERDLRQARISRVEGVRFPLRHVLQLPRLNRVEFVSVDVGIAHTAGNLRRAQVTDCRFEDMRLERWMLRRADVRSSSFARITTGQAARNRVEETRFEHCRFERCRISESTFTRTAFRDVGFIGLRGSMLEWLDCTWQDVTMSGQLRDAVFMGSFAHVDLARTALHNGALYADGPADVRLPQHRTGFFVDGPVVDRVLRELAPAFSLAARSAIAAAGEWHPNATLSVEDLQAVLDLSSREAEAVVERCYPHRLKAPQRAVCKPPPLGRQRRGFW